MAQTRTTYTMQKTTASKRIRETHRLFFKVDRPRAIDQYIDYFGGAGGASAARADDLCGETLLERLA